MSEHSKVSPEIYNDVHNVTQKQRCCITERIVSKVALSPSLCCSVISSFRAVLVFGLATKVDV